MHLSGMALMVQSLFSTITLALLPSTWEHHHQMDGISYRMMCE